MWDFIINKTQTERTLFHSVLTNCSFNETEKKIIISTQNKDDFQIIKKEKSYLNSLLNQLDGFSKKLVIEIDQNLQSEATKQVSLESNEESELIRAIKLHLNGQERR